MADLTNSKGTFMPEVKEAGPDDPPWINLNFYRLPDHLSADLMVDLELNYSRGLSGPGKYDHAEKVKRFIEDHVRAIRIWKSPA